jgi:hypothetical protein
MPVNRGENVRLIVGMMGVDEAEAEFVVSIERGESPGDVFIAGGKNNPSASVQADGATRPATRDGDDSPLPDRRVERSASCRPVPQR